MSGLPAPSEDTGGIRHVTKRRLFQDLDILKNEWKILVLDQFTARIISSVAKHPPPSMQVQEEYLPKRRAPFDQEAIYYVNPTLENVERIVEDFKDNNVLYRKANILFSSRVLHEIEAELRRKILSCKSLVARRGCLQEFNLEYCVVDNRTVTTLQPEVLSRAVNHEAQETAKQLMISRLSTVFATLCCFPDVRYQAESRCAKGVCKDVAVGLMKLLTEMRQNGVNPPLPKEEDGDLLVLDRSYDITAPFLHPWSFEAMTYDYVPVKENFVDTPEVQRKEYLELNEDDEWWVQLRHLHFQDAATRLITWDDEYNKKYRVHISGTEQERLKMRHRFAEFDRATGKLRLHKDVILGQYIAPVGIGTRSYAGIKEAMICEREMLTGQHANEARLLNGRSSTVDWSKWKQMDASDRQRLLICWLAAFPQHMTPTAKQEWMSRLNLDQYQVEDACNIASMGAPLGPPSKLGDLHSSLDDFADRGSSRQQSKVGAAVRYNLLGEDLKAHPQLLLDRIIRELHRGELPADKFPYLNGAPPATRPATGPTRKSRFDFRPPAEKKTSRRLIVFVIGGVCREEMRVVHQLSVELKRDIILVTTSVGTGKDFLKQLSSTK